MRVMKYTLALALVACGGDGTTKMDASVKMDAPAQQATVVAVDCASNTPAATVVEMDTVDAFMPMATTINMGQVVKFTTSLAHNLKPNPIAAKTDPGLSVDFNMTKCLRFTATGTFGFMCSVHSFVGTVTVN
jgi:plastocyanin